MGRLHTKYCEMVITKPLCIFFVAFCLSIKPNGDQQVMFMLEILKAKLIVTWLHSVANSAFHIDAHLNGNQSLLMKSYKHDYSEPAWKNYCVDS